MKRMATTLALLALALLPGAAGAIGGVCSEACNGSSRCFSPCSTDPEGTNWITCGEYGVCDPDYDDDGYYDWQDNCMNNYNPSQPDCDGDSWGNACDWENGDFRVISTSLCHIRGRVHLVYVDVRKTFDRLLRDYSACGSPDKWQQVDLGEHTCPPMDAMSCCIFHYGNSDCNAFLNNNQCHY